MSNVVRNPYTRKFGVEIECGFPGGMAAAKKALIAAGFRFGYDNGFWSIENDGTDVEIKTPPLQGPAGFATLKKAYKTLLDGGAFVTRADGTHVHHDASDFFDEPARCYQFVEAWTAQRETINTMVSKRRHKSEMCKPWTPVELAALKQAAQRGTVFSPDGYKDVNFKRIYGTFEFRMLEGTLDYTEVSSWIKFVQRFMHTIVNGKAPDFKTVSAEEFLDAIHVSAAVKEFIRKKAARVAEQPTPKFYDDGRRANDEGTESGYYPSIAY